MMFRLFLVVPRCSASSNFFSLCYVVHVVESVKLFRSF